MGLPYFLLAATGPLLQAWFRLLLPVTSPYRLYALSNAGSLLALLSYPFFVEPLLRLPAQSLLWSAGLCAFAALCTVSALKIRKVAPRAINESSPPESGARAGARPPGLLTALLWLGLAACGSVMLLAVTNQICGDIAVVPFLWILPLALYLLSFILCFENERLYFRPLFWPLLAVTAGLTLWLLKEGVDLSIRTQVLGFCGGLWVCCMVCHGELVRLKPDPRYLTLFYLMIAAGGALGGLFVTAGAPVLFPVYLELHIGLWACCAFAVAAFWHQRGPSSAGTSRRLDWIWLLIFVAALGLFGEALRRNARAAMADSISLTRNFYGTLRVAAYYPMNPERMNYTLQHGRISHGTQFADEKRRRQATSYYGGRSGVGLALLNLPGRAGRRVGVVGLGTGTLAAYGRSKDRFTFYEINPAVIQVATSRFTYLQDSAAACDVLLGDARIVLERQEPQNFDLLVLDAFSSDAIPVHLLTLEAFETYLRHLGADGIIAVHITNRYLDLAPVVKAVAQRLGLESILIESDSDQEAEIDEATWMLLTRNGAFLGLDDIRKAASLDDAGSGRPILWTDDYTNLFQTLK